MPDGHGVHESEFHRLLADFLDLNSSASALQCVAADERYALIRSSPEYAAFTSFVRTQWDVLPEEGTRRMLDLLDIAIGHPGHVQAWVNSLRGGGHVAAILQGANLGGLFQQSKTRRRTTHWALIMHYAYACIFQLMHPMAPLHETLAPLVAALVHERSSRFKAWSGAYQGMYGRELLHTRWERRRAHALLPDLFDAGGSFHFPEPA